MSRTIILVAAGALIALPSAAGAQHRRHYQNDRSEGTITYSVGVGIVDDGVYQDSLSRPWSVRIASPVIGRILVGEVGLGGLSAKTPAGERERFLIPEAQLQLQLPLAFVATPPFARRPPPRTRQPARRIDHYPGRSSGPRRR